MKKILDLEKTFYNITYFTNGDNLLDGYMVEEAIRRISDNEDNDEVSFDIIYESGKQNSVRYYEIMEIKYYDDDSGECTIKDLVFKTEYEEEDLLKLDKNELIKIILTLQEGK